MIYWYSVIIRCTRYNKLYHNRKVSMYHTISLLSDETVRIWWSDPRIELDFLIRSESYPEEALLPRGSKSILVNKLVQTKNLYLTAFLFNETKPITPHIIETRSHTRSLSRVQSYMYFLRVYRFSRDTRGDHSKIASFFISRLFVRSSYI